VGASDSDCSTPGPVSLLPTFASSAVATSARETGEALVAQAPLPVAGVAVAAASCADRALTSDAAAPPLTGVYCTMSWTWVCCSRVTVYRCRPPPLHVCVIEAAVPRMPEGDGRLATLAIGRPPSASASSVSVSPPLVTRRDPGDAVAVAAPATGRVHPAPTGSTTQALDVGATSKLSNVCHARFAVCVGI
jgi:hypothetical protein